MHRGLPAATRAALCALAVATPILPLAAQALPGQVRIDPDHPQWLELEGGGHPFYCGTGDPEDFFYRGTRLPDGTRDGDQDALLDRLATFGGNTLYLEVVRSHGGDGQPDHNPFVNSDPAQGLDQDILDQWEGWLQRCEDEGILIYLFIYDDSARVWSTGNQVHQAETDFITGIVDEFEHHPNLIWLVSEESEEAMSHAKVNNIADIIANADEHGHIIGNHHHSGTTFKAWQDGGSLNHFSMHYNIAAGDVHAGALEARGKGEAAGASGNGYFTMFTECNFTKNAADPAIRRYLWDSSMAGVMPMVYGEDIATTSDDVLRWCRIVQTFFEGTDFHRMESRDDLASAGTTWVLAAPPAGYIAYADGPDGDLGLTGTTAGFYDLHWVDTITGATAVETGVPLPGGGATFARPAGIGDECAVWLTRVWTDLGLGTAGASGVPTLDVESTMIPGDPIRLQLDGARSNAFVWNVAGFSPLLVPFEGGTMVPSIDVIVPGGTDGAGAQVLQASFPAGLAPGDSAWIQCWVADPTAPSGLAASNGVQGMAP